jgi:hypothetical protein
LKKLLGNQKKDDIVFYKAIIDNTHFWPKFGESIEIIILHIQIETNFLKLRK